MIKKVFSALLVLLLLVLTACLPNAVEHPIREEPTESEFQALVESLQDKTVSLIGYYMGFELSLGSGIMYHKEPSKDEMYYYYVLTNNHVVSAMTHVIVRTNGGNDELGDIYAFPIAENDTDDIAIVRFESAHDYPLVDILPLDEETNLHVQLKLGQTVFSIGSPLSTDYFNLVSNLGIISELGSYYITHTSNINPGNSGGPLFSYDGTFIGINTQRVEVVNGETIYLISDAIHVNAVAPIIRKRIREVTPKLGITINDYNSVIARDYSELIDEDEVFNIYDHLPENESGIVIIDIGATRSSYGILQMYDLIKKVNGISVTSMAEIAEAIGTVTVGAVYTFDIIRKDVEANQFINLTLEVTIQ